MSETLNYKIRRMSIGDYSSINKLWRSIKNFAIRQIDDSKVGIERFLKRNKSTCVVAICDKKIVGSILCGHDGREAAFYHVCVKENMRNHGIATSMVNYIVKKLKKLKINKIKLVAFRKNVIGNEFWRDIGFELNDRINVYEKVLNDDNVVSIV